MKKIWKLNDAKSDQLIAIQNGCIYKSMFKNNNLDQIDERMNDPKFLEKLFGIPFSYIQRIENQKGSNHIKIYFSKESEEELVVANERIKQEIFDFMKESIPGIYYNAQLPNVLKYAAPQIFAMLLPLVLFMWSTYLAFQLDSGAEYILYGTRVGVAGIALGIAHLGITKILMIYIPVAVIGVYILLRKLKTRSVVEYLRR